MKPRSQNATKNLLITALFVALVAASAFVSIQLPSGVPVTLQTLTVSAAGYCLKVRKSLAAVGTYLLMGLLGLPVFSGFNGGLGALFGKTGGFLFGFLVLVAACGAACHVNGLLLKIVMGMGGLLGCHLVGVLWFTHITGMGFWPAVLLVSVPFLLKDAICVVVAALLSIRVVKIIHANMV